MRAWEHSALSRIAEEVSLRNPWVQKIDLGAAWDSFSNAVLPVHKVMHLAFLWLCRCTVSFVIAYTGHSFATICAYFKYFRELVNDSLDELDF